MKKYPADKKYDDRQRDDHGEDVARSRDNTVNNAEGGKQLFSAKKSIENHLDTSNQDHTKPPENQGMQNSGQGFSKDLGLPESNFQHHTETLPEIPDRKISFGESEITDDPADSERKNANRDQQCEGKDHLFGHAYFDLISLTASTSFGRILLASPTMPYWAVSNTGASLSVLIATMYLEALTPAICCVAPEIPMAK